MSEIEKMYKNANVYINLCECAFKNLYDYYINYGQEGCTHPISEIRNGCKNCKLAEQNVKYCPPFTPEKQIELVKWIAEYKEVCRITYEKEYEWCTQTDWQSSFCYKNFEESIANLINTLWQSLTEGEKRQIKEILK